MALDTLGLKFAMNIERRSRSWKDRAIWVEGEDSSWNDGNYVYEGSGSRRLEE